MDQYQITHPPLSQAEFERIADTHKSANALLPLREVERLSVVQSRALQLLTYLPILPGLTPPLIADDLLAVISGRLPGGRQFKLPKP